jgi:uncharacterized protein YndB with AHSA1/START domain
MESITNAIDIAAPADKVFQAITTTEGERAWWTTDCEVGKKVGDQAAFRFNPMSGDKGTMEVRFSIDRLDKNALVRWTCTGNQNNPDWQDTEITFVLAADGKNTRLGFAHTGWRAKSPVYEACVGGWTHFLNSLKAYVETGKGTPHVR